VPGLVVFSDGLVSEEISLRDEVYTDDHIRACFCSNPDDETARDDANFLLMLKYGGQPDIVRKVGRWLAG
jgi:hypothetical protein